MLQLLCYVFDFHHEGDKVFGLDGVFDRGDVHVRGANGDRPSADTLSENDILQAAIAARRLIVLLAEALARQAARDDDARERNDDGGARSKDQRKL